MNEQFFIGIDGGGTSTTGCLISVVGEHSRVIVRHSVGGSNPQKVGWDRAQTTVSELIHDLYVLGGKELGREELSRSSEGRWAKSACFALAGMGEAESRRRMKAWIDSLQIVEQNFVIDDISLIFHANSDVSPLIALIAGTGSIAFGRVERGEWIRAGGWGALLGDDGSGWWIGRESLRAIFAAHDEGLVESRFQSKLLASLNIESVDELSRWHRQLDDPFSAIAGIASHVLLLAEKGDPIANRITLEAASALANSVKCVVGRLDVSAPSCQLIVAGSLLVKSEIFLDRLHQQLARQGIVFQQTSHFLDPELHAAQVAKKLAVDYGLGHNS